LSTSLCKDINIRDVKNLWEHEVIANAGVMLNTTPAVGKVILLPGYLAG
jgi:hypothetical protein